MRKILRKVICLNQKIFDAAQEFEKIADFDDDKLKEKNHAIAARKQMLDILRKFFAEIVGESVMLRKVW